MLCSLITSHPLSDNIHDPGVLRLALVLLLRHVSCLPQASAVWGLRNS